MNWWKNLNCEFGELGKGFLKLGTASKAKG